MANSTDAGKRKLQILVVDDKPDVAMMLAMLLKTMGHEAQQAYSGNEAVDTGRQRRPDLVFLDISLPDIDGYEVARRLRDDVGLDHTVLIALSGYAEDEERFASSAFDRHWSSRYSMSTLKEVLAQVPVSE